jgi:hypothetical protein
VTSGTGRPTCSSASMIPFSIEPCSQIASSCCGCVASAFSISVFAVALFQLPPKLATIS